MLVYLHSPCNGAEISCVCRTLRIRLSAACPFLVKDDLELFVYYQERFEGVVFLCGRLNVGSRINAD